MGKSGRNPNWIYPNEALFIPTKKKNDTKHPRKLQDWLPNAVRPSSVSKTFGSNEASKTHQSPFPQSLPYCEKSIGTFQNSTAIKQFGGQWRKKRHGMAKSEHRILRLFNKKKRRKLLKLLKQLRKHRRRFESPKIRERLKSREGMAQEVQKAEHVQQQT